MKKYFILISTFFLFILAKPVFAQAVINDFSAEIKINNDSSLEITETINYDFGADEKHGIYRDIYYKYKLASGNFKLGLSDISVTDEKNQPYMFSVSDQGNFKRIKIGDPNQTTLGVKIYKIKYKIRRAINFFADHDELYWNVTGNDWQLPIKQVKAEVALPQSINETELKTQCFAGPAASDKTCLSQRYLYSGEGQVSSVSFISDILNSGEGLTIVVGLPKGVIKKPSAIITILETIKDNWIVGLPIIIFIIMFYLWYKRGRDPRGRGTIIAQFEAPDNLTPAEVGTLIDEFAQNRDISSQIIYLAVNGYLKINRLEKKGLFGSEDFELAKLKNEDGLKNEFEKKLFSSLFKYGDDKVLLSDLKEKFYKDLVVIKKDIYQAMAEKGYFTANPEKVRKIYLAIGVGVLLLSWFFGSLFGWLGIVSLAVSGGIIILFGFFMPEKTIKGVSAKEHILGLKLYLKVAEQDRINFHNAPAKNPQLFEKLLPYAMVLGVEKEWAKKFEGIYNAQPSWYNDPSGSYFSAMLLTNSLNNFSTHANSAIASAPSSAAGGGSGFSGGGVGGGFGGGGGGSW
jgi:uncharacterized membrane protein